MFVGVADIEARDCFGGFAVVGGLVSGCEGEDVVLVPSPDHFGNPVRLLYAHYYAVVEFAIST